MKNILKRIKSEFLISTMPVHKKAASNPRSVIAIYNWVNRNTNVTPQSVVEIGANYCQDAYALAKLWNIAGDKTWAIEAHPKICAVARKIYSGINILNEAVYNEENELIINFVKADFDNSGVSSLLSNPSYDKHMEACRIKTKRMSNVISEYKIDNLDFVKVDVEGVTHEVLQSFDNFITDVKLLHLELEHKEIWKNQKTFIDTESFLLDQGFTCGWLDRHGWQSDSIWLNEKFYR